jgi:PAS domain-containing protein
MPAYYQKENRIVSPPLEIHKQAHITASGKIAASMHESRQSVEAKTVTQFRVGRRRDSIEEELRKAQQESVRSVAEQTAERNAPEIKAALLGLANDAIVVKTSEGAISYWNNGAERLYGWRKKSQAFIARIAPHSVSDSAGGNRNQRLLGRRASSHKAGRRSDRGRNPSLTFQVYIE